MMSCNVNGTSVSSVQTNSQLPIPCSDVNSSASVGRSRNNVNTTSASCSPWQSGVGQTVSRNDGDETTVKAASEPDAAGISLHSAAAAVHQSGSCDPSMPFYVGYSGAGSSGEDIVNLRADDDDRRSVNESRLSRDGLPDMTVVDASPDEQQTSTHPESHSQQSVLGVQCTQKSDRHSEMHLPARNASQLPALPVNNNTPGCGKLAVEVDRQQHNREADDNSSDVRSGCSASAAPNQLPLCSALPQPDTSLSSARVPPATSTSRHQHPASQKHQHQQPHSTGSEIKSSTLSSMSHRQSSRPLPVHHNLPSSVHVSSSGMVNVYNMTDLTGPVQIGDHNTMHVGGTTARHYCGQHHSSPSSSSSGRRRTRPAVDKPKKQITVADRVVDSGVLQRVSLDIGSDWTSLGRQLGCSDADLDNLKYDHRDSGQSEIAYQMLRGWHEQNGSDAKLAVLARALIDVRRPDVARKLQDVRRQ